MRRSPPTELSAGTAANVTTMLAGPPARPTQLSPRMVTDQGWPEKPLPNPACPGQDANDLPARVDDRLAEIAEAHDLNNRSLRRRRYRDDISPPPALLNGREFGVARTLK